jgi:hypothetical protein
MSVVDCDKEKIHTRLLLNSIVDGMATTGDVGFHVAQVSGEEREKSKKQRIGIYGGDFCDRGLHYVKALTTNPLV